MAQANIDYDVQGIRGGEPHHKNNVGNVTVETEGEMTFSFEAFTEVMKQRNRRYNTLVTIKEGDSLLFAGTPAKLKQILCEVLYRDYPPE